MGYTKILTYGNILETYEFERQLPERRSAFRQKRNPRLFNSFRRRRPDNVHRLRKKFIQLVSANLGGKENPAFLTLTFRDNIEIQDGYKRFHDFARAIRRTFGKGVRYIAVPEFGTRNTKRLHYHVLIWGLSNEIIDTERKTRKIAQIWGQGYLDIIKTDGNEKLAFYFGKYLSKALYNERLAAQKAYVASRNVLRPLSLTNSLAFGIIDDLWAVDKSVETIEKVYSTMWLGRCVYKRFKIIPPNENNCN